MKLELKHLSPYLPYKLYFLMQDGVTKLIMIGIKDNKVIVFDGFSSFIEMSESKPILRPISDLEKIIEIEFSKLDDFKSSEYNSEIIELFCFENISFEVELSTYDLSKLPYKCIEFMFKNHYDIFGLIEKGLAISIHDTKL